MSQESGPCPTSLPSPGEVYVPIPSQSTGTSLGSPGGNYTPFPVYGTCTTYLGTHPTCRTVFPAIVQAASAPAPPSAGVALAPAEPRGCMSRGQRCLDLIPGVQPELSSQQELRGSLRISQASQGDKLPRTFPLSGGELGVGATLG